MAVLGLGVKNAQDESRDSVISENKEAMKDQCHVSKRLRKQWIKAHQTC